MSKQLQLFLIIFSLITNSFFAQTNKTVGQITTIAPGQIQNRGCATQVPSQQWEAKFQEAIAQFLAQNPQAAKSMANASTMSGYSIPVIMHVIHGGQAVGTYPNLAQAQLVSQVTVLDNDFSGVGQNVGNYPATAFQTYATNPLVAAASKDASLRIGITNCNINFCLATKDTLGNILAEPGIHRVNYNSLPATSFASKNPAYAGYNTPTLFTNFINGYIKPNTIWNVGKYLNIWVTDEAAAVGLLGYATFPPLTGLTGLSGPYGTATTDGFWSYAKSFGSSTIFPGGTYAAPYDKGRTCTHEIGHWLGLRHIWGDGTCATDYCNDTPPAQTSNFGAPSYPYHANQCTAAPANVNGDMFMNFMDYTDDLAMYMFTNDQRTRAHVAMSNSPYRKFLGTHGLCNLPAPLSNFTVAPNPVCVGATLNIGDLSLNVPSAWSYTMTGGTPSLSSVQNPTVSYAAAGVYTILMTATNGAGTSTVAVKTVTVNQGPAFTLTSTPGATVCAGNNVTITPSGATTYTLVNNSSTTPPFIVTPAVATVYSVSAITSGTNACKRTQTLSITIGTININITPASPSVCPGSSVTLTGSGATTYTWNTTANTAAISVTPATTTVYTLNGTNGGCTGTKTVQVTVNPLPTVTVNSATICPSSTVALTAGGANTYSWSTSATTTVIIVSPAVNTNYTVTGTSALGCKASAVASVVTSGALAVNITATPTIACAGQSRTLTATGATTYTWNTTASTSSIVVTPSVTTTYTVNGNTGSCAGSKTISILVNANPTVVASTAAASVCAGGSTTVSATGAATYTWMPGSFVGANYTVTPASTTIYTVTGTNGSGCTNTKTVSVFVTPAPSVTLTANPATMCSGSSATLTASGATTYSWSVGGTGTTKTVTPALTTVYTITGTTGSCSSTKTISVVVNPTPTVSVNNATICPSGTATLIANGANTYSWSTSATTSVISVSPASNTTYTVTGTSLGCSNTKTVSVSIGSAISINVSASPSVICGSGSSTLNATGATTYTWSTSQNGNSIVVAPSSTTNYTVYGTSGTCTGTSVISVSVSNTPITAFAGPNQTLCISNPATTLAGNTPTAGSGNWSVLVGSANIASPGSPNSAVTAVGAGTNILQWTVTNGGCFNSSVVYIYVNALPTVANAGPSQTVCLTTTNLSGNAPGVGSGTWSLISGAGSITSPNAPSSGVTGLGAGSNIFQWSVSNGACAPSTSTVEVMQVICTGIAPQSNVAYHVTIYPNPFKDELTVNASEIVNAQVFNTLGQLVIVKTINGTGAINTSELAAGVYYINVKGSTGSKTLKIIKE